MTHRDTVKEAQMHVRVALIQVVDSDDSIIIGHVRDAPALLTAALAGAEVLEMGGAVQP
jgi:hypothetical protein